LASAPLLQFPLRHEGYQQLPVLEQRQVKLRSAVVLEKKRDHVRVNYSGRTRPILRRIAWVVANGAKLEKLPSRSSDGDYHRLPLRQV
jgi:hypothetical protein